MLRTEMCIRIALLLGVLLAGAAGQVAAQDRLSSAQEAPMADGLLPSPGVLVNGSSLLVAQGDSLWVGPFLNLTVDDGESWQVVDADSLSDFRNRVFSLDARGELIVAGLGNRERRRVDGQQRNVNVARGFIISEDGGQSWTYRSHRPPLTGDPNATGILDVPEDTVTIYGASALPTLPIISPASTPPRGVAFDPDTGALWSANVLAGLRRSSDLGRTWERVVLPPDTLDAISPDQEYDFPFYSQPTGPARDNFAGLNFQAYSVHVDSEGRIWAGTAGGINVSEDGVAWQRHGFDVGDEGLPCNWITAIQEQMLEEGSAIWLVCRPSVHPGEQFALVVTSDGGASFEVALVDERIYDVAFRGEAVYAAGRNGLFISDDGGASWRSTRSFLEPINEERTVNPDAEVLAVATTTEALWIGTDDGVFRSLDGGESWRLFRPDVPLHPDDAPAVVPREAVPEVDAFAYPNPFSPASHRLLRIRYDLEESSDVVIRIYDFAMNVVRELRAEGLSAGPREATWDGTDRNGALVANGTYFYTVESGGRTARGKILVLE